MFKSFRTWFDEYRQVLAYSDPKRARHWHNPVDPIQAARIEAAAVKRARRAKKLRQWAGRSIFHNFTHGVHCISVPVNVSLNPFYVAK